MSKSYDENSRHDEDTHDEHRDKIHKVESESEFLKTVEDFGVLIKETYSKNVYIPKDYVKIAIALLEEALDYDGDTIYWVNEVIDNFKGEVLQEAVRQKKNDKFLKNLVELFSADELSKLGLLDLQKPVEIPEVIKQYMMRNSGADANSSSIPSAQDQEPVELAGNSNHEVDNQ